MGDRIRPPSSCSSVSKKERTSLSLDVLSRGPLLGSILLGRLFTRGSLLHLGSLLGGLFLFRRLLDDAGGLHLLLGDLRRRRDRDGDLFGLREQRHAFGEREVTERQVLVHAEVGDVERDLLRYIARERLDLYLVGDLLQDAALIDARRVARNRERNRDLDALLHVHRREVYVDEKSG